MKILHIKYLVFVVTFLLIATAIGTPLLGQRMEYRRFHTRAMHQKLMKEDLSFAANRTSIEQLANQFKVTGRAKKVTLPIVFHVMYSDGSNRLGESQLITQLEALNRDFGKKDFKIRHRADVLQGFSRKSDDMFIEFCLAAETPDGQRHSGVNYIPMKKAMWAVSDSMKMSELGGFPAWDTDRYINVWICDLKNSAGFAQLPGGPAQTDGIVIDYRYVGIGGSAIAPYNEGKTLTHLIGNYLNLLPLWGFGRCQDDGVDDTPIHNSPNLKCPGYKHFSTCDGIAVEMTMNFMDNTDDACMYMFTSGQKLRMQAMLAQGGPRAGLLEGKVKCKKNPNLNNLFAADPNTDNLELDDAVEATTEALSEGLQMRVFPNPANQEAFYQIRTTKVGPGKIRVLNASGGLQFEQNIELIEGFQEYRIDCKNWTNGLYLFVLSFEDQQQSQRLMVINKK